MHAKFSEMSSFPPGFTALIFGASGGIGSAIADCLQQTDRCAHVECISRSKTHNFDVTDEKSLSVLSNDLKTKLGTLDLIFDSTGVLALDQAGPEKSLKQLDAATMQRVFAINAIGPALLMKHFGPLMPVETKGVFATLGARVGSIGDNSLGGWYSYRASKAALNQLVKTAAIEFSRKKPNSVCIALHPGTVETDLSRPFAKNRFTHTPSQAAIELLEVIDRCDPGNTGSFLDYSGNEIPW